MTLYADLWDNDYASPGHVARLGEVLDLSADWGLPGGLKSFTVPVLRRGRAAVYTSYSEWDGYRLIISDHFGDRPILDGTVVDLQPRGSIVIVTASGPIWRLFDDLEKDAPGASDVSSDVIKTALTDHATIISSDQSNIVTTTMPATGFTLPVQGMHVGRLIEEMLLAGDGSGNPLLFWLEFPPFDVEGKPQKPVAHLEALAAGSDVDWQVWARDKVVGSNSLGRDISDLATSVTATYRDPDNIYDTNQGILAYQVSGTELSDSGQSFTAWATTVGQAIYRVEITNTDDTECRGYLGATTSSTQIKVYKNRQLSTAGFTGANPSGKTPASYRIYKTDPTEETAAATNNTSRYWTRKRPVSSRGMPDATTAGHVRDVELARLSEAQLRRSFVLGAREVMAGAGGRWPLWRLLMSGGYMRDNEIGPEAGLFDLSLDYKRVGRITSMSYNHGLGQLHVILGESTRLDAVLAKFGYDWRLAEQIGRQLRPLF